MIFDGAVREVNSELPGPQRDVHYLDPLIVEILPIGSYPEAQVVR